MYRSCNSLGDIHNCYTEVAGTFSAPHISLWLNEHPGRGNNNAPLLYIKGNRLTSLSNAEICKILQSAANRAGVQKCIRSHNSRQLCPAYQVDHSSRTSIKRPLKWTTFEG